MIPTLFQPKYRGVLTFWSCVYFGSVLKVQYLLSCYCRLDNVLHVANLIVYAGTVTIAEYSISSRWFRSRHHKPQSHNAEP